MRKIKFRAWAVKEKYMADVAELSWRRGGLWADGPGAHIASEGWVKDDNLILMQYTGLKDKNGKEIYEGDVVKTGDGVGRVEIDHGSTWVVIGITASNLDVDLAQGHIIEVVGNIYENPELVGKEEV